MNEGLSQLKATEIRPKNKADEIFKDGKVGPFGSRAESYVSE